eukprot:TRINITY_DN6490_c0_g1_i3.p1 TRINITY_DN6490_c0_g1~~TRINITY_DN6490_c0_g1_i3.p1  ORF type:complete len:720 (+),score=283.24 TRINITY_DN6490_c0_g1_i3:58-2160(+)
MQRSFAAAFFAMLSCALAAQEAVTPAEKVLKLVKKLKTTAEKDGAKDEEDFKAYAKFCDKAKNEKAYQIEKSAKKIRSLDADIGVYTQGVNQVSLDLEKMEEEKAKTQRELDEATATRTEEAEQFASNAKEIDDTIQAIDRATQALEVAKDDTVALSSMKKLAKLILTKSAKQSFLQLGDAQLSELDILDEGDPKTHYKSGDVLALMRGLKSTFATNKQALHMSEEESKGTFNKLEANLMAQLKFIKQDIDEKSLLESKKASKKAQLEKDKEAEQATKEADESFLADLTEDCAEKAQMAAQRATKRKEELEALVKAIAKLEEGGVGVDKAAEMKLKARQDYLNQEDSFVQTSKRATKAEVPKKASRSFLQVREKAHVSKFDHQMAQLEDLDARMGSKDLSLVLRRIKAQKGDDSADPLAEVRKLIKDLIEHKEEQIAGGADHKAFCDQEVEKHTNDTENYQAEVVSVSAQIESDNATEKKTAREVAELSSDISKITSDLNEATKLRADEKASNEATILESKEGAEACSFALDTLKSFYQAQLLQTAASPKKIDPDAPEVNMGSFEDNAKQRSTGVLGLLEVLRDDYTSTKQRTEDEETNAADKFEQFKTVSQSDIAAKQALTATKTEELAALKAKLLEDQSTLEEKKEQLKLTLDSYEELKGMCSADVDKAAAARLREESIEVLKNTLGQLDDIISKEAA